MEILKDKSVRMQQGEPFVIDYKLSASNKEYIPYLVSSELSNPFFVMSIASTRFEKNNRIVVSIWSDISTSSLPRFYGTTPIVYGEITNISNLPNTPPVGDSSTTRYLYRYTLASDSVDDLNHKPYYYFYFDYSGATASRIDSYECRVAFNVSSDITKNWISQNYIYQITLVSGELLSTVLTNIAIAHGSPADWPSTIADQYNYVKLCWPNELQEDIDADSPLGYIQSPQPILLPTALLVYSNAKNMI